MEERKILPQLEETKKIKEFQESPPKSAFAHVALRYLITKLNRYIGIIKARFSNPKKASGEVYRNLLRHSLVVQEYIDKEYNSLMNLLSDGEEIFYPDSKEKIVKKDGEIVLISMSNSFKEWKKAYKEHDSAYDLNENFK